MKNTSAIKNTPTETSKNSNARILKNEYLGDVGQSHRAMHVMILPEENTEVEIFDGTVAQRFQNS